MQSQPIGFAQQIHSGKLQISDGLQLDIPKRPSLFVPTRDSFAIISALGFGDKQDDTEAPCLANDPETRLSMLLRDSTCGEFTQSALQGNEQLGDTLINRALSEFSIIDVGKTETVTNSSEFLAERDGDGQRLFIFSKLRDGLAEDDRPPTNEQLLVEYLNYLKYKVTELAVHEAFPVILREEILAAEADNQLFVNKLVAKRDPQKDPIGDFREIVAQHDGSLERTRITLGRLLSSDFRSGRIGDTQLAALTNRGAGGLHDQLLSSQTVNSVLGGILHEATSNSPDNFRNAIRLLQHLRFVQRTSESARAIGSERFCGVTKRIDEVCAIVNAGKPFTGKTNNQTTKVYVQAYNRVVNGINAALEKEVAHIVELGLVEESGQTASIPIADLPKPKSRPASPKPVASQPAPALEFESPEQIPELAAATRNAPTPTGRGNNTSRRNWLGAAGLGAAALALLGVQLTLDPLGLTTEGEVPEPGGVGGPPDLPETNPITKEEAAQVAAKKTELLELIEVHSDPAKAEAYYRAQALQEMYDIDVKYGFGDLWVIKGGAKVSDVPNPDDLDNPDDKAKARQAKRDALLEVDLTKLGHQVAINLQSLGSPEKIQTYLAEKYLRISVAYLATIASNEEFVEDVKSSLEQLNNSSTNPEAAKAHTELFEDFLNRANNGEDLSKLRAELIAKLPTATWLSLVRGHYIGGKIRADLLIASLQNSKKPDGVPPDLYNLSEVNTIRKLFSHSDWNTPEALGGPTAYSQFGTNLIIIDGEGELNGSDILDFFSYAPPPRLKNLKYVNKINQRIRDFTSKVSEEKQKAFSELRIANNDKTKTSWTTQVEQSNSVKELLPLEREIKSSVETSRRVYIDFNRMEVRLNHLSIIQAKRAFEIKEN